MTKAAWDEQVLSQEAYDEQVLVSEAYDEPMYGRVDSATTVVMNFGIQVMI